MSYRVRFHLAKGPNFLKWQVKNMETGDVSYHDPKQVSLRLRTARLKNQKATALKINQGANKSVCAWVEADEATVLAPSEYSDLEPVSYNPKIEPFWRDRQNANIDGTSHTVIVTEGNRLFTYGAK